MTKEILEFEELVSWKKGGVCVLKRGNFYPVKTINIPSDLQISGRRTKIYFDDKSPFPVFRAFQTKNTVISKLDFVGKPLQKISNKTTLDGYNYKFIFEIHNSSALVIDKCRFVNSYGTTVHLSDCREVKFKNSAFRNIGLSTSGDGMYSYDGIIIGAYNRSEKITISGCDFSNIGTNFPQGVPNWPNDGDGIHIQGKGEISDVSILSNRFYRCASRGIKVQSGSNISIQKNHFEDCWTAVNMAMAKDIHGADISNNILKNCRLSFGTDCLADEKRTAYGVKISQNSVDNCLHFFRTSGQSSVSDALISGNSIDSIGTYFFTGRMLNARIENNTVLRYATANDPTDNMAIYISPESDRLIVQNNVFGKSPFSKKEIVNQSKNEVNIGDNQFLPYKIDKK